jgi:hypothetical protein
MLPNEDAGVLAVRNRLQLALTRSAHLHDVVVSVLLPEGGRALRPKEWVTRNAVNLSLTLAAKAAKTFRAIELVASHGLGSDAEGLARSLYETGLLAEFILQRDSKQRVAMYYSHAAQQNIRMLKAWSASGQSLEDAEEIIAELLVERDSFAKLFPSESFDRVMRHWSGTQEGLLGAARLLGVERGYHVIYRMASQGVHAVDFTAHGSGHRDRLQVMISPNVEGVDSALRMASVSFWNMALRLVDALGLEGRNRLMAVRPPDMTGPEDSAS